MSIEIRSDIPTFNDKDTMQSVRVLSLNPTIEAVNTLKSTTDNLSAQVTANSGDIQKIKEDLVQGDFKFQDDTYTLDCDKTANHFTSSDGSVDIKVSEVSTGVCKIDLKSNSKPFTPEQFKEVYDDTNSHLQTSVEGGKVVQKFESDAFKKETYNALFDNSITYSPSIFDSTDTDIQFTLDAARAKLNLRPEKLIDRIIQVKSDDSNVDMVKVGAGSDSRLKITYDNTRDLQTIEAEGFDFDGTAETFPNTETLVFDERFVLAQDTTDVTRLNIRLRHEGSLLGIFESFEKMIVVAKLHKGDFNKGLIVGLVHKATNSVSQGYTVHSWNGPLSPTAAEIALPGSWDSSSFIPTISQGISVVPNFPTVSTHNLAAYKGQILYCNADGMFYFSDGSNWRKMVLDGSGTSIRVSGESDTGSITNMGVEKITFSPSDFRIDVNTSEHNAITLQSKGLVVTEDGKTPITDVHGLKFKGASITTEGSHANQIAVVNVPKISGKAGNGEEGVIESIDVIGDTAYSSLEDGELTLNIQSNMLRASTITELNTLHPASANPYRLGFASDTKKMYVCDGESWNEFSQGGPVSSGLNIALKEGSKPVNILEAKNPLFGTNMCGYKYDEATGTLDLGKLEHTFIGKFPSTESMKIAVRDSKIHFKLLPYVTYALVRKQAIGVADLKPEHTSYYRVHTWTAQGSAKDIPYIGITDDMINDDANWVKSDRFLGADYPITIVGEATGSEHPDWSPTKVDGKMKASDHLGQIVYFNDERMYFWSDGDKWNRLRISSEDIDETSNVSVTNTGSGLNLKLKLDAPKRRFVGLFEGIEEMVAYAAANKNAIDFNRGHTFSYVRKASTIQEGNPTAYYVVWKWNSDDAKPSANDIKNTTNWESTEILSMGGYTIPVAGFKTTWSEWNPDDALTNPKPTKYKGQIFYYNNQEDSKCAHYWSDGKKWNKFENGGVGPTPPPTPTGSIQVNKPGGTYHDISQMTVIGDMEFSGASPSHLTLHSEKNMLYVEEESRLNVEYPPASYSNRFAFANDTGNLFVSSTDGTDSSSNPLRERKWYKVSYRGGGEDLEKLMDRFAATTKPDNSYSEVYWKNTGTGYRHVSLEDSKSLNLPNPAAGFIFNLYARENTNGVLAESIRWTQIYYVTEVPVPKTWIRTTLKGSTYTTPRWSEWAEYGVDASLDSSYYSVLVMDNDQRLKNIKDNDWNLPMLVYQDPRSNIIPVPENTASSIHQGAFKINKSGKYNVSVMFQPTWLIEYTGTDYTNPQSVQVNLYKEGATQVSVGSGMVTYSGMESFDKKGFPMAKISMNNLVLEEDVVYIVSADLGSKTKAMMEGMNLDPYKNMVAIDPASSASKTGASIMNTLYRTLGGLSFDTGYEVRMQPRNSTVRVVGERYRTDVIGG